LLAGKYRVERTIGEGGMAVVYAAYHQIIAQRVALKIVRNDDKGELGARFVNEARAAARLHSEHVARVLDVGILDDGSPYMAMELLEGSDLAKLIATCRLPPMLAVDYVLQALEAVAEAHANGIIHRDLKPANLFVANVSGRQIVKVLDFGISKATDAFAAPTVAHTSTSAILGTPAYMSPEQLRSSKTVDPRADIWSIGVILYELLSGQPPFAGETVGAMFSAILERSPAPLSSAPPGLAQVVARCIEKEKQRRYASVADLAEALAPFGSPEGAASAERIRRIAPAIPPVVDEAPPAEPRASAPSEPRTAGNWSAPTTRRTRSVSLAMLVAVPLVAICALAVVGFGTFTRRARTAAPPIASAPEPPASVPAAVAVPPKATTSDPDPEPSARPDPEPSARPAKPRPRPVAAPAPKPSSGLTSDRHGW
jgi:serine/threonine-protein kinase